MSQLTQIEQVLVGYRTIVSDTEQNIERMLS